MQHADLYAQAILHLLLLVGIDQTPVVDFSSDTFVAGGASD